MKRQPFTLLIHIALAVIVAGAIVTHYCGIQGELTLPDGGQPVTRFHKSSGPGDGTFPFSVALERADVAYYPGTVTPMDFSSHILVNGKPVTVSMNKVGEVDGWRFYQSGISATDSTLAVSYDPWGIGITYTGYALLFVGFIGFLFQRDTPWRALLRKRAAFALLLSCCGSASYASESELPAMQRPLAANLGKVYVYWNDRICPLQTMARDVTAKLYGGESYRGMTSEQVLSGWLFYFDRWERDWQETQSDEGTSPKARKNRRECEALIRWMGTGEAFRVYPYHTASGAMEWLSLTGRRPSQMSLEQWKFMQTTIPRMQALLSDGKNIACNELITELMEGQRKYAGREFLPSEAKMTGERIYNTWARPAMAGTTALVLGLISIFFALGNRAAGRKALIVLKSLSVALAVYIMALMALLWWIAGHLPLSNGPETMLFMALVALLWAVCTRRLLIQGAVLTVGAMSLFVAAMGGCTPQIGALMPVLGSPLLSVHVMLVMTSYVLFSLMSVLSAIGLCVRPVERKEELCRTNRILLVPAVFLLGAGIFVGAVWANQSWGRYWGWDPKETCALVTFLVYSLPVHWGSRRLACFRRPKVIHRYLLSAVLTVAFTYFGANYLIPGLHSYA